MLRIRQLATIRNQNEGKHGAEHIKERSLGAMVLLLENLATIADPLGTSLLKSSLPHALVAAQYTQAWSSAHGALRVADTAADEDEGGHTLSSAGQGARS